MKIRKEYLILIAIILALSLYLTLRNPDRALYSLPQFPDLSKKDISKIEIILKDTTITLERREDHWDITPHGYRADDTKVEKMLDLLSGLTLTALVSESKKYERYELNSDKKITVKAWKENTLQREFDVGKAASSYRHTFIRIAGNDRVFHAHGNFRGDFDQTTDKLRDKAVLSFDSSQIREIRIATGSQSMELIRKQISGEVVDDEQQPPPEAKKEWESPDGRRVEEAGLMRLLMDLSKLKCDKYIYGRDKDEFVNPVCTVRLKGEKEYTLSIFAKSDKSDKTYPAISSENDYPYLLPERQVDKIMKAPDEILKKPDE